MDYQPLIDHLTAQRNEIDSIIHALAKLSGAPPVADPPPTRRGRLRMAKSSSRPLVREPKRTGLKKRLGRPPKTEDAGVSPRVAARDSAVLEALRRAGGIAKQEVLLKAMPKEDMTEEQTVKALQNSLQRVRLKGLIGRTGDTWSLSS